MLNLSLKVMSEPSACDYAVSFDSSSHGALTEFTHARFLAIEFYANSDVVIELKSQWLD